MRIINVSCRAVRDGYHPFSALTYSAQHFHNLEARSAVSSGRGEAQMLRCSSSEDLDLVSIEPGDVEDSPPHIRAYEELMDAVTILNIERDWGSGWHPQLKHSRDKTDLKTVIIAKKASAKKP